MTIVLLWLAACSNREAVVGMRGPDAGTTISADASIAVDSGSAPDSGTTAPPDAGIVVGCGNGLVEDDEACDDSNLDGGDGCESCALTGADELFLQVREIPALADRVYVSLDAPFLPAPAVRIWPTEGRSVANVRFPVTGGPHEVRVVATTGEYSPAVLAGSYLEVAPIPEGGALGAVTSLEAIRYSIEPETPARATIGTPFTVAVRVSDPARMLEGLARVWSDAEPFEDLHGSQTVGELTAISPTEKLARVEITAGNPNVDRTMFYQFAEASRFFEFEREEQPWLVAPSTRTGALETIAIDRANTGMNITITDVPPSANRVYLSIDGPALPEPLHWNVAPAGGTAIFSLYTPAGADYTIRAAATTDDGVYDPVVVAAGLHDGTFVMMGSIADVRFPVSPPSIEFDAGTPVSVPIGRSYELAGTIRDPSDSLGTFGRIWWTTGAMSEHDVGGSQELGDVVRTGPGTYRFRVAMPAPSTREPIFYRFAESLGVFEEGVPVWLALPALAAGEPARRIDVTEASEGIELDIAAVDPSVDALVVVIDRGSTVVRYELAPAGPVHERLGVPPGGPYRVRVVGTNGIQKTVVRGGRAGGITVSAGAFAPVAVVLSEPVVRLDASTPASAPPSSSQTVALSIDDPADFIEYGRLDFGRMPFENGYAPDTETATITRTSAGHYSFRATFTTPAFRPSTVYFQMAAYGGIEFEGAGEAPAVYLPNTDLASLFEMAIE
jgi:cysteine-rich repeat protein